tara:strand:- start:12 stop:491 length:480 start_codon:yes stop_codon:yes gene_type:complete
MVQAIYPGSFDPITYGHIDIVKRATKLFDGIIIAVAEKKAEKTLLNIDERVLLIKDIFSGTNSIKIITFDGLITNLAKEKSVNVIIRGVRSIHDFDYEFKMTAMNKKLYDDIETVFLTPTENFNFISSSLVREIALLGGDVTPFVPEPVKLILEKKFLR